MFSRGEKKQYFCHRTFEVFSYKLNKIINLGHASSFLLDGDFTYSNPINSFSGFEKKHELMAEENLYLSPYNFRIPDLHGCCSERGI